MPGTSGVASPDLREADLREARLSGAKLSEADLFKATLTGADLSRADLFAAHLSGVSLAGANLSRADLSEANLSEASLPGANLRQAKLFRTNLSEANLRGAKLGGADLSMAYLFKADLREANLFRANLNRASLDEVDLREVNLFQANLTSAYLSEADLSKADLRQAILLGSDLSWAKLVDANLLAANLHSAILVETDLTGADLSGCRVYGVSAWGLTLERTKQQNLVISNWKEAEITVDNIEIAQFIHVLLNNSKIGDVIDTINSKVVLILGRFTLERKKVLDRLREELRRHDRTSIIFDFEPPNSKNVTDTVKLLTQMARYIIIDLSDPNSAPYELGVITMLNLDSTPLVPLIAETQKPFPMLEDVLKKAWCTELITYKDADDLALQLDTKIVNMVETKVHELQPHRRLTSGAIPKRERS